GCVLLVGGTALIACGGHVDDSGQPHGDGDSGGALATGGIAPATVGALSTGGHAPGVGGFVGQPPPSGGEGGWIIGFPPLLTGGASSGGAPGFPPETGGAFGVGGHFVGQPPSSGGQGGDPGASGD